VAQVLSRIRHRRYEEVGAMLDEGVPPEAADEFGNTLLLIAAQTGSKRMCKMLLRRGASLSAQNRRGQTVLHFCYAFRYTELGDYLSSKGADATLRNDYGLTCQEGLEPPLRARLVSFADSPSFEPAGGRPTSDDAAPGEPAPRRGEDAVLGASSPQAAATPGAGQDAAAAGQDAAAARGSEGLGGEGRGGDGGGTERRQLMASPGGERREAGGHVRISAEEYVRLRVRSPDASPSD
ncbi:ankyrin repeat-containing domain protein, partial [Baffinella frigidus]